MAGFGATAPMTVVMELLYRRLPRGDRAPLPPAAITTRVSARAGHPWPALLHKRPATPPQWTWLTLAGHFAYGGVAGAMYGPLGRRLHLPPFVGGAGFGVLVWLVSYLGWLPIAGLFPSASSQGAARNGLMIVAHLVWGGALGLLIDASREVRPDDAGATRARSN